MKKFWIALALAGSLLAIGCGDTPAPEAMGGEDGVARMTEMRGLYDKVKGDWNALTAEDKAAFTKLAGDDAKAQKLWATMSGPPGAGPGSSGPPGGAPPAGAPPAGGGSPQ